MQSRIERARLNLTEEAGDYQSQMAIRENEKRVAEQQRLTELFSTPRHQRLLVAAHDPAIEAGLREIWDYSFAADFGPTEEWQSRRRLMSDQSGFFPIEQLKQRAFQLEITSLEPQGFFRSTFVEVGFRYDTYAGWNNDKRQERKFQIYLDLADGDENIKIVQIHSVDANGGDASISHRAEWNSMEEFLEAYARQVAST